ncbi:MAG: PHP domain-containing protein [Candidatus Alcyoniella australis]|nr:PHP domain-containing protein [Candidatus Alcyoniella australis]
MIKVDLHCHTHHSPDCWTSPRQRVEQALAAGLGGLAITDHNTIDGALEAAAWADGRLRLIVGQETSTRQGELLGLFLQQEVPSGLELRDTAELIREQGGLVYLPHPMAMLAWDRVKRRDHGRIIDLVDIVEAVNGRNFIPRHDAMAWAWGAAAQKALAASTDAHTSNALGRIYQRIEPFEGPADFLDKMQRAQLVIERRANPLYTALTVLYLYPNLWYRRLYRMLYGRSPVRPETPPPQ